MSDLGKALQQVGCRIHYEIPLPDGAIRIQAEWHHGDFVVDYVLDVILVLYVVDDPRWGTTISVIGEVCAMFIGADALCQYDDEPTDQGSKLMHAMCWHLTNPVGFLRRVVNGGTVTPDAAPPRNLILLGGRKLSDYEDAELKALYSKEYTLRTDYAGIYGKDPGACNIARIEHSTDLGLFLEYCEAVARRTEFESSFPKATSSVSGYESRILGYLSIAEQSQLRLALAEDYIAAQICERNHIPFAEPSSEHELAPDEDLFSRWFDFYGDYVRTTYSDEEVGEIYLKHYSGEDISSYAPSGDWRNYRPSPKPEDSF